MPYLILRESIGRGEAAMIRAGTRDRALLTDGWSELVVRGNVTARFATKQNATVRIPLQHTRSYKLLLRIDPFQYPGAPPQKVQIDLNSQPIAALDLAWNPERVGQYELSLPPAAVRSGSNTLSLHSEHMAPIGRMGDTYREIPRDRDVGLRFWYLLIVPS